MKHLQTATLFCFVPNDKSINRVIISRPKCGSRFLKDCGAFTQLPFNLQTLEQLKHVEKFYWVIREPKKHFYSALITELHSSWQLEENPYNKSKKIKIKTRNEQFVLELLETLLQSIKGNLHFSHYQPIYEDLFELMKLKYEIFYKVTFVELDDLSNIVEQIFNTKYSYHIDEYAFKFSEDSGIDITTKNISEILNTPTFLPYWDIIQPTITKDSYAYDKISKLDFSKFLVEKINELLFKIELTQLEYNESYVEILTKLNTILKINKLE
jgi:hypothetical protein